jgi:protein-disulfide isomerase
MPGAQRQARMNKTPARLLSRWRAIAAGVISACISLCVSACAPSDPPPSPRPASADAGSQHDPTAASAGSTPQPDPADASTPSAATQAPPSADLLADVSAAPDPADALPLDPDALDPDALDPDANAASDAPPPAPSPPSMPDLSAMPSLGADPADALVTVIVWVDFESQISQRLRPLITQLLDRYKAEVRVLIAQHPQPQHSHAAFAAQAALAAHAQGKFWSFYEVLLDNAATLASHEVEVLALRHGIDLPKLRGAIEAGAFNAQIDAEQALALAAGFRAAPGVLIDGVALSGLLLSWDQLEVAVEAALADSRALSAGEGLRGEALRAARFAQRFSPVTSPHGGALTARGKRLYIPLDASPSLGQEDALVTAVMFTSFNCSYCQDADQRVRKLMAEDPSRVRLVFKHSPADDPMSQRAHLAAAAAHRQGQFWPLYHWLMAAPPDTLTDDALRAAAQKLGLDLARFDADLKDPATLADLQADADQALTAHVRGAPHFFLNGVRFSGAQPLGAFRAAFEREAALAQSLIDRGEPRASLYALLTSRATPAEALDAAHLYQDLTADLGPNLTADLIHDLAADLVAPLPPPAQGPQTAPSTLISFIDFGSPFCADALLSARGALAAHPEAVRWEFRHFPIDTDARSWMTAKAALAAHHQGAFWPFLAQLEAAGCAANADALSAFAAAIGLDLPRFAADLADPALDALIRADIRFAHRAGLSGAPGFLVNGDLLRGAQPQASLDALITPAHPPGPALPPKPAPAP